MTQQAQKKFLKDYKAPLFSAIKTDLTFNLQNEFTIVTSEVLYHRAQSADKDATLELSGNELELLSVSIDDTKLSLGQLDYSSKHLSLSSLPESFTLTIQTKIFPAKNTALEGLYKSGNKFCTQCEPEGFRRITYFLDRPDVMSEYTTTILADKTLYPVLLSNGNLVKEEVLDNNRHKKVWHDPYPKPSYLFALVAGSLAMVEDYYTTKSGRKVTLRIFVEQENIDKCSFAMQAIKDSMKWDERVYGLEYDLDIFMIVAVSDFNMGAMENKGLNIFNAKYVLANPSTATDLDFENIQSVIGHEYFHNWSGNRVTCRDWFQLSLKEGLTVFRDQEFSADMNSRSVNRIKCVKNLRSVQFSEDSSPMAHPVRPDNYIEINNFYTSTIYIKGAEVIRMIYTILGKEKYHQGIKLYFQRFDGQAVTIEDFVRTLEDASGVKLTHFKLWYEQAGTPTLHISSSYDEQAKKFSLNVRQSTPDTPGHSQKKPFVIPIKTSLITENGEVLPFSYNSKQQREHILLLEKESEKFVFNNIPEKVIPSLLRGFSAPVYLKYDYSDHELIKLLQHDTDEFNRWEAVQTLILSLINKRRQNPIYLIDTQVFDAVNNFVTNTSIDPRLISRALLCPDMDYLISLEEQADIDSIWEARQWVLQQISEHCSESFVQVYQQCLDHGEFELTGNAIGKRELKEICLRYLLQTPNQDKINLAVDLYKQSNNMTDTINSLTLLANIECRERNELLDDFYNKWKHDALVLDKWFTIQATSTHPMVLDHVKALIQHPDFDILNPNRTYSVLRHFGKTIPHGFHRIDGEGYRILRENILKVDSKNAQVAAVLAAPFSKWQKFDKKRQEIMVAELQFIAKQQNLSKDVFEIVSRSLNDLLR